MSSNAAKKMAPEGQTRPIKKPPHNPSPQRESIQHRFDLSDEGFDPTSFGAEVNDTFIIVGAETMTASAVTVTVEKYALLGLSNDEIVVGRGATAGPFTIGGEGNEDIELDSHLDCFDSGNAIATIHVDP